MPTRRTPFKSPPTEHQPPLGLRLWRMNTLPRDMIAHTHPDIELNWFPQGMVAYEFAGRRVQIDPGQLGIFWGGFPHHIIDFARPRGGLVLTLPLAWFLRCNLPHNFAARLMLGELFTVPLAADRADQWRLDYTRGPSHHRLMLLELEALLARLALALPPPTHAGRSAVRRNDSLPVIDRLTAFMARHYQEPIAIDDLATHVNLHPKYLMQSFRKATGITLKNYLLRLRIAHAQRLLATSQLSVLDVAMHAGFGSLSRFYDAFDRHVKQRPLAYRRKHRG